MSESEIRRIFERITYRKSRLPGPAVTLFDYELELDDIETKRVSYTDETVRQ
jgi:hypothetical protein